MGSCLLPTTSAAQTRAGLRVPVPPPRCALDLAIVVRDMDPIPVPTDAAGDLSIARRRLDLLRTRARTLRSIVVAPATEGGLASQGRQIQRELCRLVWLSSVITEARDTGLSVDALVELGDAFEHGSEQLRALPARLILSPAQQGHIRRARAEIARRPRPPAPTGSAFQTTYCPVERPPRATEPPPRATETGLGPFDENASADEQLAVEFYAHALWFAALRGEMTPQAWRALDRLQSEELRPHAREWVRSRRGGLPEAVTARFDLPTPGETLLATQGFAPPPLAP